MSLWITQHFLNSALFWPGVALLALPLLIHLINRLRYRRVRFAAMEFLLASQKRNRRRVLLEQLLLLLSRLALVALVVALIGRLVLDPNQLSLFQGARSHHVLVLDDSASMRDLLEAETSFDNAKAIIRRIVAEGARQPGSQMLTLVLMSTPDKAVAGLSNRVVDEILLSEITDRLDALTCTHQAVNAVTALEAVQQRLAGDRATSRHVHVLSDFRKQDWTDNKATAALLKELSGEGISLNLVRCAAETHENLGVTALEGAVEVAAAKVPVSLNATVQNWGSREAENVSAAVFVDGVRLPRSLEFQTIAAGQSASRRFDVVFPTAEAHAVSVQLQGDAFEVDNQRDLAVDVPADNPVLIVDGSPAMEQARYLADALAADKSVTGFAPDLRTPEELRRISLQDYALVYLVNVAELAPDALAPLETYVTNGGGLVWYMGDAVRPAFYNDKLFRPEGGLFPVKLGPAPESISETVGQGARIEPGQHPLFAILTGGLVPILDQVNVNLAYRRDKPADDAPVVTKDATVVASAGGSPLMYEHTVGRGRVFTCLTSAGPLKNANGVIWTNWANGPVGFSFVVFQLELAKRLVRKDRSLPPLSTGETITLQFDQAKFSPELEVVSPDERVTRLAATPAPAGSTPATLVQGSYRDTDQPGVYRMVLTSQDQRPTPRLYAVNVPSQEGALAIMQEQDLRRELGETPIEIQPAGSFEWIHNESPGSEMRHFLLSVLALVCIGEQLLASRLSYQGGAGA